MLALSLVAALAGAAAAPVALEVSVHVADELDDAVVAEAIAEAERIFAPGGVELRVDRTLDRWTRAAVTVVVQPRPARFKVQGCSRGLHDHRLGHAQIASRRVRLYAEHIARAASGDWDSQETPLVDDRVYGRALGRVLAHEIGHLLLRLDGHRNGGLMREAFSHRSLTANGRRPFLLANRDLNAIREAILALPAALPRAPADRISVR